MVKALFEHRMLPRVLAGSSVGSIVAGLVATRTDDELRETFRCVPVVLSLVICVCWHVLAAVRLFIKMWQRGRALTLCSCGCFCACA